MNNFFSTDIEEKRKFGLLLVLSKIKYYIEKFSNARSDSLKKGKIVRNFSLDNKRGNIDKICENPRKIIQSIE